MRKRTHVKATVGLLMCLGLLANCQSKTNEKPIPDVSVKTPGIDIKVQNDLNENIRSIRIHIQTIQDGFDKTKTAFNLTIDSKSTPTSILLDILRQVADKDFKKDSNVYFTEGSVAAPKELTQCHSPLGYRIETPQKENFLISSKIYLKSCQTNGSYVQVLEIYKNNKGANVIRIENAQLAKLFPVEKFIAEDLNCSEESLSVLKYECESLTIGKHDGQLWKATIKVDASLMNSTVVNLEGVSMSTGLIKSRGRLVIKQNGAIEAVALEQM